MGIFIVVMGIITITARIAITMTTTTNIVKTIQIIAMRVFTSKKSTIITVMSMTLMNIAMVPIAMVPWIKAKLR